MAASVKIEFDDGSRVISQTLEETAGFRDDRENSMRRGERRPPSCSLEDYFEIPKTTDFIANGKFRRVALQFPDPLLEKAPEVLWTIQARLRKLEAERGEVEGKDQPLIFVTGDTSYGSCCVDEIAAQHLKADAIVHYGRACLSPTNSSVPVLYVFGREDIDVADLATALISGPLAEPTKAPVLLLYDVTYAHTLSDVLETLGDEVTRDGKLVVGFPVTDLYSSNKDRHVAGGANEAKESCGYAGTSSGSPARLAEESTGSVGDEREGSSLSSRACCGEGRVRESNAPAVGVEENRVRSVGHVNGSANVDGTSSATSRPTEGVSCTLYSIAATGASSKSPTQVSRKRLRIGGLEVDLESEEDLKRHTLVFIGGEGRQLSNVLLRCVGCVDQLRYDPTLCPGQRVIQDAKKGNKDLMRRYYLVQRAKEASVVGIVVGTLGVRRYGDVVRSIRKMVEDAGRKAYTLAVGKVNVAKLANFAEVDVFCLVACAENSLLDSREFHAPVVTPLEIEVALGKREWDGFYSTDFDDLREVSSSSALSTPSPLITNAGDAAVTGGSALDSLTIEEGPKNTDDEDGDRPFFSLVTGSFKNVPGVPKQKAHLALGKVRKNREPGALVPLGDRSLVEWSSPAADFLDQREFKGLEALVGQTEAKPATEGQSGIASDYGGF